MSKREPKENEMQTETRQFPNIEQQTNEWLDEAAEALIGAHSQTGDDVMIDMLKEIYAEKNRRQG